MATSTYEVGDMYWGKPESYPWWPCIIVPEPNGEYTRYKRRIGHQYHVQFLGPDYDGCWITDEFLIRYVSYDRFQLIIKEKLSVGTPNSKIIYSMEMSDDIRDLWKEALIIAESLKDKSKTERIVGLPKPDSMDALARRKPAKVSAKRSVKRSRRTMDCIDMTVSPSTSHIKQEKDMKENSNKKSFTITPEIEDKCRRAFIVQETLHRLSNNSDESKDQIEEIVKTQWRALDSYTKLLYLNDETEVLTVGQSKVSGRRIKVPNRLRAVVGQRITPSKLDHKKSLDKSIIKHASASSSLVVTTPVPEKVIEDRVVINDETAMTKYNIETTSAVTAMEIKNSYKELFDVSILRKVSFIDCATEIMKNIVTDINPLSIGSCYSCFSSIEANTKYVRCRGKCEAIYHFHCAVTKKLFRSDDVYNCVNCVLRLTNCCICKNSKYMKKQILVKCIKDNCDCLFHSTCLKFLNYADSNNLNNHTTSSARALTCAILQTTSDPTDNVCPTHFCLTCAREDNYHPCNFGGPLLTCIKCPVSFHSNNVCIPAGCRVITSNKIICHRHTETTGTLHMKRVKKCFVCYEELATLRCCRCLAVFHPKCMAMPTYTDLLKDYCCPTCKLEKPMYHGEVVWVNYHGLWEVGEIANYNHVPKDYLKLEWQCLYVKLIKKSIYLPQNRCDVIPYSTGLKVLADQVNVSDPVIVKAGRINLSYFNWRKRLYPFTKSISLIGLKDLMSISVVSSLVLQIMPCLDESYNKLTYNVYKTGIRVHNIKKESCRCTSKSPCTNNSCKNVVNRVECSKVNCSLDHSVCQNRKFSQGPHGLCTITNTGVIDGRGIKAYGNIQQGKLIGECTGQIITALQVVEQTKNKNWSNSTSYIFHLKGDEYLSCEESGNEWRFLNHSCSPNCQVICWNVDGKMRLGVFTLRNVQNEELTINYFKNELVLKYGFICKCNQVSCANIIGPTSIFQDEQLQSLLVPRCCSLNGYFTCPNSNSNKPLLASDQFSESNVNGKGNENIEPLSINGESKIDITMDIDITQESVDDSISNKSNEIALINSLAMEHCYQCGGYGELIFCQHANCSKSYHLHCVEESQSPSNVWYCPLHFCRQCQKASVAHCNNCPISHCSGHSYLQNSHFCRHKIIPSHITQSLAKPISNNVIKIDDLTENEVDDKSAITHIKKKITVQSLDVNIPDVHDIKKKHILNLPEMIKSDAKIIEIKRSKSVRPDMNTFMKKNVEIKHRFNESVHHVPNKDIYIRNDNYPRSVHSNNSIVRSNSINPNNTMGAPKSFTILKEAPIQKIFQKGRQNQQNANSPNVIMISQNLPRSPQYIRRNKTMQHLGIDGMSVKRRLNSSLMDRTPVGIKKIRYQLNAAEVMEISPNGGINSSSINHVDSSDIGDPVKMVVKKRKHTTAPPPSVVYDAFKPNESHPLKINAVESLIISPKVWIEDGKVIDTIVID